MNDNKKIFFLLIILINLLTESVLIKADDTFKGVSIEITSTTDSSFILPTEGSSFQYKFIIKNLENKTLEDCILTYKIVDTKRNEIVGTYGLNLGNLIFNETKVSYSYNHYLKNEGPHYLTLDFRTSGISIPINGINDPNVIRNKFQVYSPSSLIPVIFSIIVVLISYLTLRYQKRSFSLGRLAIVKLKLCERYRNRRIEICIKNLSTNKIAKNLTLKILITPKPITWFERNIKYKILHLIENPFTWRLNELLPKEKIFIPINDQVEKLQALINKGQNKNESEITIVIFLKYENDIEDRSAKFSNSFNLILHKDGRKSINKNEIRYLGKRFPLFLEKIFG
jgi:hypothetical protein